MDLEVVLYARPKTTVLAFIVALACSAYFAHSGVERFVRRGRVKIISQEMVERTRETLEALEKGDPFSAGTSFLQIKTGETEAWLPHSGRQETIRENKERIQSLLTLGGR